MTKQDAANEALEALATGEAETAIIGQHPVHGWVWRDGEDAGGIVELHHREEVFQADHQDIENRKVVIWEDGQPGEAVEVSCTGEFDLFAAAVKLGCEESAVRSCGIGEMQHYGVTLR